MASISTVPPETLNQIIEEIGIDQESIFELASVSKAWYYPIMTRVLKEISVFSKEDVEKYIRLLNFNSKLASMIETITVYGDDDLSADLDDKWKDENMSPIDLPSINKLLKLLPNLNFLRGYYPVFLNKQFAKNKQLPILPAVTTLDLEFAIFEGQDAKSIDQIIKRTPQLASIGISIAGVYGLSLKSSLMTSTIPFHKFDINISNSQAGLLAQRNFQFFADNIFKRFPISSFVGLKKLHLHCGSSIQSILEVAKLAGSSLTTIKLYSGASDYKFTDLDLLFPHLYQLQSLGVYGMTSVFTVDFFQHLPTSIKKFDLRSLSFNDNHFLHLQANPKPNFNLLSIKAKSIDSTCFNLLPPSVRKVYSSEKLNYEVVYQALTSRKVASDLWYIETSARRSEGEEAKADELEWVKKFKAIGIDLKPR